MARINQYVVVGYKKIDYTKDSGKEVHGCEVYLEPITKDDGIVGTQCEAVYLSDSKSSFNPVTGYQQTVKKVFNQWGKVEDLVVI